MEPEQTRTAVCVAGSPGPLGLSQYLLWAVEALCEGGGSIWSAQSSC